MSETEEIWRFLPGFDNAYEISNQGRIRSYRRNVTYQGPLPRMLELKGRNKDGYIKVCLRKNGKDRHLMVHSLVLHAFGYLPQEGQDQVCHANGVRDDNRLENLRWGTAKDNADDRDANGPVTISNSKLTEKDVRDIRALRLDLNLSYAEIGRMYNISTCNARYICIRRTWKHID